MVEVLKQKMKFRGGARVPHFKDTNERATAAMPAPDMLTIPMQQHIGAPCKPCVKPGDAVTVGQLIGDTDVFVSAPIHAGISGKVKKIVPLLMPGGQYCDAVQIENDGLQTVAGDVRPPQVTDKASFLKAVRTSGLVGIGGAGFPLHVKLSLKEGIKVDTLLINGAECEPFITSDYREIIEYPQRIIAGMELVMAYLGIEKGLICVEDNKPLGIKALTGVLAERSEENRSIRVVELSSGYPQGAEKMIIYAATGRRVPAGGLPADVNCIVMNVSTVSLLDHCIKTGMPLIQKRVTVAGDAISEPGNVLVPIGAPIKDVIAFCGGYKETPERIIMGGPMMGLAQYDDAMPILKQNNAILALTKAAAATPREDACIRCGMCHTVCPMSLTPTRLEIMARAEDAEGLQKQGISSCMECGSCAYACPAHRPLVQYLKYAKTIAGKAVSK